MRLYIKIQRTKIKFQLNVKDNGLGKDQKQRKSLKKARRIEFVSFSPYPREIMDWLNVHHLEKWWKLSKTLIGEKTAKQQK